MREFQQRIHNSVSFQLKTKEGSVLVCCFLHWSPGNSRLPGQPSAIVLFPLLPRRQGGSLWALHSGTPVKTLTLP